MIHTSRFTIDGIQMQHVEFSRPMGDYMPVYNANRLTGRIFSQPEPWTIALTAQPMNRYEMYHLVRLGQYNGCGINFATLGPGDVCPYCGQYNAAGRLSCWSCGGEVERVPFIKPVQFPVAHVTTFQMEEYLLDQYKEAAILIELSVPDLDMEKHIRPLAESSRLETLQHGMHLDGSWLCEFCGSAVEYENAPCPTCGGYQLPYTELLKIDRECVYCGNRVENGMVCKACGGKLAGLTWSMVKGTA